MIENKFFSTSLIKKILLCILYFSTGLTACIIVVTEACRGRDNFYREFIVIFALALGLGVPKTRVFLLLVIGRLQISDQQLF